MKRVVLDTNVLISATMFAGPPGDVVELARSRSFQLVTSAWLIDEFTEKLRVKFKLNDADARKAGELITDIALVITPQFTLQIISRDPDDDHVLECAIAARADMIVTGDKHLLDLAAFEGVQILNVRQFLTQFLTTETIS